VNTENENPGSATTSRHKAETQMLMNPVINTQTIDHRTNLNTRCLVKQNNNNLEINLNDKYDSYTVEDLSTTQVLQRFNNKRSVIDL
jgi:hypothetical protein